MTDETSPAGMSRRRFLMGLGLGSAALAGMRWPGSPAQKAGLTVVKRSCLALGAPVTLAALHEERAVAERALGMAFDELMTVESVMSLYRPESEVSRLNRDGTLARPHRYLVEVLEAAAAFSQASGGAFDVTVQPLWTLYSRSVERGWLPTPGDVERVRRRVDWHRVAVSSDRVDLAKGTEITLNGIAQGFAVDRVLAVFRESGIRHALVDTGEIGSVGRRVDGSTWTFGVRHPRKKGELLARFAADGRSVSTTGDYETCFTADFAENHIFDPHTGHSPGVFQSVTVLAPQGLAADALSTAVFVSGLERGLKLIASTPGADAMMVLKNGKTVTTGGFPGLASAA